MKRVHIRQWMVILLSGFLQQPVSGMMNPFGIAYFGAAYMWPEHRSLLPVISLIGMAAGIPQNMLLKYLGILIGIMLITYILEWKKAWVSQHEMLLMLSLLILSADIGYGLAREGITAEAALRQLRFGAIEAVFGAVAFAGQMGEIAEIMDDLSLELSERKENSKKLSDVLVHKLEKKRLKIKKISVTDEGSHGRRQKIYMLARVRRGRCMTVKELAEIVSETAGQRFIPEKDSPGVVSRKFSVYELVEDTRYRIIQGIARRPKEGEPVNGDSYAFIYLDSGQVLMSLSDGMGSGEKAKAESELMINLLEQMVDTGFARRSALRMINSVMMFHGDRQLFSSMDLSVIDLYSGICEFIKVGASSTFIKRGEKVECVTSGSLPMGVFPEMDCEGLSRNLFDGDVIVMVTDGVINRFNHGNDTVCDLLSEMDLTNPNAMASEILNEALDQPGEVQQDDMTVLVCTICKKSAAVL